MELPIMWLDLQRLLLSSRYQELSLEGGGVYLKLLAAHWVCGPKGLPGSLEKIAQLLATTPEKLRPHWEGEDQLKGFFALKDGRWVNDTAVLLWERAKGHKDRKARDVERHKAGTSAESSMESSAESSMDGSAESARSLPRSLPRNPPRKRDDERERDDDLDLDLDLKKMLEDKSSTSRSRSYGRPAPAREADGENSPKTRAAENSCARLEAHYDLTPEQRDNVKWLRAHFSPNRAREIALEISFTEEDRRAWEAWRKRHGDIEFKQKVQTFQNPKDAPKAEKGTESGSGYDVQEEVQKVVDHMARVNAEKERAKRKGHS